MNKELKALERIKYKLASSKANGYWEDLDIIESALEALEIIKEKVMSLVSLDDGEICKGHYRVYDGELYMYNELTKEEYDLLKEALI